jgi:hypothetical protein
MSSVGGADVSHESDVRRYLRDPGRWRSAARARPDRRSGRLRPGRSRRRWHDRRRRDPRRPASRVELRAPESLRRRWPCKARCPGFRPPSESPGSIDKRSDPPCSAGAGSPGSYRLAQRYAQAGCSDEFRIEAGVANLTVASTSPAARSVCRASSTASSTASAAAPDPAATAAADRFTPASAPAAPASRSPAAATAAPAARLAQAAGPVGSDGAAEPARLRTSR